MEAVVKEILNRAGLKCTPGRAALLKLLIDSKIPLAQEEISSRLTGKGLNKVNIYRALESFIKVGLVHRIDSSDRIWRFAYCGCGQIGHCHPHFICRSCGSVECLLQLELPNLTKQINGYTIEERELYLKGLCPRCN